MLTTIFSANALAFVVKLDQLLEVLVTTLTRGVNFILAFVVLSLLPIFSGLRKLIFESKRWSESMFTTSE